MRRSLPAVLFAVLLTLPTYASIGARPTQPPAQPQPQVGQAQTPQQFFGFRIGADGELARYPKILEYFQHLSKTTNRVKFQELGKTTMGNPYVLATISAPENLARLDRLIAINRRLADPRGLTEAEAKKLAQEGRAFYLVYATIHSTEVGNTQALTEIVHRLATDSSAEIKQILDNVVLLVVPSQNPDGQVLVVDHWYKTKGTPFARVYPDLYHKYVGHDDNRDWFMFTQIETRLAIEKVHSAYKPIITHDMHQQGANASRIFVPPFDDPYDPNVHPILAQGITSVGQAMASALVAEGKTGVEYLSRYDLWAPARQYMVYHGQPRILTEIASVNLADPFVNPAGKDVPLGPQEVALELPGPVQERRVAAPADRRLRRHRHVRRHRRTSRSTASTWLENFYKVHADWVNRKSRSVRVRRAGRPARSVRDLRAARHPPHRRSRDPPGEGAVHGRRTSVRRGIVGHQAGAAVRRVREDDAGAAAVPGPAAVSRRSAEAAVRRDRAHARPADGRRGRSDRAALRGEPRSGEDASSGGDADACGCRSGRTSSDPSRTPRSSRWRGCRRQASPPTARPADSRAAAARLLRARGSFRRRPRRRASWPRCRMSTGLPVAAADKRRSSRRLPPQARRRASACGAAPTTCRAAG